MDDPLVAHAQNLAESNRYLTLATVDAKGLRWSTPVYFTADDELECFYWMSAESSKHSQNIAARPDVSLTVFDSTVPAYHGRCLYAAGTATVLTGHGLRRGLSIYPGA